MIPWVGWVDLLTSPGLTRWLGSQMASLRCPAASAGSPRGSPGSLSCGLSVSNLDQRLHNMGGSGFPRGRVQHARSPKGSPLDPTHITLATSYRSKQVTRQPAQMRGAEGQQTQAPLLMPQTAASRCEGDGLGVARFIGGAGQRVSYSLDLPQVGSDPLHLCFCRSHD